MAVVRIETRGNIGQQDVREVADRVLEALDGPSIRALEIDFDARQSEREFYRSLLTALRERMPKEMALTMTALVSWCGKDSWMRGLPVVEAVPMFFRMGRDPHRATEKIEEPLCQTSLGVSTDEMVRDAPRGRRMYVFHPHAWTEEDYRAVLRESRKWR